MDTSFITVFQSTAKELMHIDPVYVRRFPEKFPKVVGLIGPTGEKTGVIVEKVDSIYYFDNGWSSFVRQNSLEESDIQWFNYEGDGIFSVKVLCQKPIVMEPMSDIKKIPDEKGGNFTGMASRKRGRGRPRKDNGANEAVSVGNKVSSNSKHPFPFSMLMRRTYLTSGLICLPSTVSKHYTNSDPFQVILKVSERESWNMMYSNSKERVSRGRLSSGWSAFVMDNDLAVGDRCSFELISEDDSLLVLKVSITRNDLHV